MTRDSPDEPWPSYFLYWAYKNTNQPELAKKALSKFEKLGGNEDELVSYFKT